MYKLPLCEVRVCACVSSPFKSHFFLAHIHLLQHKNTHIPLRHLSSLALWFTHSLIHSRVLSLSLFLSLPKSEMRTIKREEEIEKERHKERKKKRERKIKRWKKEHRIVHSCTFKGKEKSSLARSHTYYYTHGGHHKRRTTKTSSNLTDSPSSAQIDDR